MERPKKISLKKYFQARILHRDGRFAKNIQYLFYAQYRCEAKDIKDCLSIALRKGKNSEVTVSDIKQKVSDFIRSDLGIHFLQKVRGSPAYFNKMLFDLLGMIRQLGPCTWFVTLSAADLRWPDTIKIIAEQQGRKLTPDEIETLSWEDRCELLRSNPVTAAQHFNNRVQMFLKYILLNKDLNPLGEITDYKFRIEFQQRGSPHVHMVAWVKDAPSFEKNTISEVETFVDKYVTCELPDLDPDLKDHLTQVQRHTHSIACRKHGKTCRFSFPRYPVRKTTAFKSPDDMPTPAQQEIYKSSLEAVVKVLASVDHNSDKSLDDILSAAGVSEQEYISALQWKETKNGQPCILLRRRPWEINVNNYNTVLMKCWEANLDVQFVTNTYACVMYVASYVSRPEKTLGDVLKSVSQSSIHLGVKQSMNAVAKKFLTHREISAQEAVYRLLSLPLVQGSREVVFIPTDLPQNRTRIFKPMKLLQMLDDDDTDVYMVTFSAINYIKAYIAKP